MSMTELEQIRRRIRKFRDDRDWMQFHNPKNLACSISIEAAELLEYFQWRSPEESETIVEKKRTEISHEIADIAIYLIELADNVGIDLVGAIRAKMAVNEAKYPIKKARGSAAKYSEF